MYNSACFKDPKEADVVFDINIIASRWEHVAADVIFGFERTIFEKWPSFLHLKQVTFLAAHTLLLWRVPPQKKHVYLTEDAQHALMGSIDWTVVLVFSWETPPTIGVWVYVYASEFFWAAWSALAWSMAIFKCSVLFSSSRCRIMFERKLVVNASLTQSSRFWTTSTDLKLHSFASNCSLCTYSSIFSSSFWPQVASKCRAKTLFGGFMYSSFRRLTAISKVSHWSMYSYTSEEIQFIRVSSLSKSVCMLGSIILRRNDEKLRNQCFKFLLDNGVLGEGVQTFRFQVFIHPVEFVLLNKLKWVDKTGIP